MDRFFEQIDTGDRLKISGVALLNEAVRRIRDAKTTAEEVVGEGLRLYGLIDELSRTGLDQVVFPHLTVSQIKAAQLASLKFEETLDRWFMERVMRGVASNPSEHPLQDVYNRLGFYEGSEVRKCRGGRLGRIVHVGSGYCETAIAIYSQYGVPVVCIEKDAGTAAKVEEVLKRFGLHGEDKIQIMALSGQQIAPSGDAVIVSAMVPARDKTWVAENMRALACGDAEEPLLVLRESSKPIFSLEYPVLGRKRIKGWKLEKVGDTQPMLGPNDPIRSQVFRVLPTSSVKAGSDAGPIAIRDTLKEI
ncbi:hypothetical protein FJZ40_03965 [Candidatus Shapirobacteria bacterium]|nr:hypothetical protein [Candidatus Shapirobacteria bacterium]